MLVLHKVLCVRDQNGVEVYVPLFKGARHRLATVSVQPWKLGDPGSSSICLES